MTSTAEYATVGELRAQIGKQGQMEDAVILAAIKAASRAVDNLCNRHRDGFVAPALATARLYAAGGGSHVAIDEAVAVSAIGVKASPSSSTYTSWAVTDYLLGSGEPSAPDYNSTPYTLILVSPTGAQSHFTGGSWGSAYRGFRPHPDDARGSARGAPTVQVTAQWGYAATVPDVVKQATIIVASRWFKRGQSAWSDALTPGDFGTLMYTKKIDPDVVMLLREGRLIRPSVA